jgi:hypothetical protein
MLFFAEKPTPVFANYVCTALDDVIDRFDCDDQFARSEQRWNDKLVFYLSDEESKMLGGTKNIGEMCHKLKTAHLSKNVYMPTEYYWLLLDRILRDYSDVFADIIEEDEEMLREKWVKNIIKTVYHARNCNPTSNQILAWCMYYFWDNDYDTPVELFSDKNKVDSLGFTETTFGVAARLAPHPDELKFIWEKDFDIKKWWRGKISEKVAL